MKRTGFFLKSVIVLVGALALGPASGAGAASARLVLTPATVEIGTFFEGTTVNFSGEIPAGAGAVLEVTGQAGDEHLMRRGRRGGLWMNVGEIDILHAPAFYLVLSTDPELLAPSGGVSAWGYKALEAGVKFTGMIKAGEEKEFFQQFLKLKERDGLYGTFPGALKRAGGAVQGSFKLPARAAPGTYRVRLSVVNQGRMVEEVPGELFVKMVGFPAMLTALAYEHGVLYGLLAVLIAILAGFIMGFLFKGKAAH